MKYSIFILLSLIILTSCTRSDNKITNISRQYSNEYQLDTMLVVSNSPENEIKILNLNKEHTYTLVDDDYFESYRNWIFWFIMLVVFSILFFSGFYTGHIDQQNYN